MKLKRSSDHHSSAQAFASFMAISLAGALFLAYLANKNYLERSNMEGVFVLLAIIFIGFLFALVYLVNNSVQKTTAPRATKNSRSKSLKKSPRKKR